MKNWKKLTMILAALTLIYSCDKVDGAGPVVRQTVNTGNFEKFTLEVPATVFYLPSNIFKVEVEAQQNILNLIKSEVRSNNLFMTVKNNIDIRTRKEINIYIEAPDLSLLQLTGNGNIVVMKPYRPDQLYLGISGNGNITIPFLETNKVVADLSGSGKIIIENGVATRGDIDINGNGLADWENLTTDSLTSRISGSAILRVFANKYIKTTINGNGSLYYKGNPIIESVVTGTGRIVKL